MGLNFQQMSVISFSMTFLFFLLIFWLVFVHKLKNHNVTAWGTFGLLGALFLVPVTIKLLITHGFPLTIPDQDLIKAYIMKFIHINHFVDPLMINLPPYYPPLFFFVSGKLSQLFNMENNILLSYSLGNLFFFSIILALLINLFHKMSRSLTQNTRLIVVAFYVFFYFSFFDFDYIFGKGYEHLSFILMLYVLLEIDQKKLDFSVIKVGVLMGIIVMLYFYPFLLFLPSLLLLILKQETERGKMIKKIFVVLGITVLVSAPYLIPLVIKVGGDILSGGKSYVFISISSSAFFPFLPNFISVQGFLLGVSTLCFFLFNKNQFPLTKYFFGFIYSFFLLNLLAMAFLKKIFLVMTPFWTMTKYMFILTSIIFLKQFLMWGLKNFNSINVRKAIHLFLMVFMVLSFGNIIGSNLYRIRETGKDVSANAKNIDSVKIYRYFQKDFPHIISNHYEIATHAPFFFLIPFHLTYAHPYSDIDGRLEYLNGLTRLKDRDLFDAFNSCPYGRIDGLVGREKERVIQVEVSRPWEIVTRPSYKFEFILSRFGPDHFITEKIGPFTAIKPKHKKGTAP